MKVGGSKTWKELTTGVQQLVSCFQATISLTPDLSFEDIGVKSMTYFFEMNDLRE